MPMIHNTHTVLGQSIPYEYKHTHTHTHTYIYAHTHTHTHTCKQALACMWIRWRCVFVTAVGGWSVRSSPISTPSVAQCHRDRRGHWLHYKETGCVYSEDHLCVFNVPVCVCVCVCVFVCVRFFSIFRLLHLILKGGLVGCLNQGSWSGSDQSQRYLL